MIVINISPILFYSEDKIIHKYYTFIFNNLFM